MGMCVRNSIGTIFDPLRPPYLSVQGHHHNGDQATRLPHMMCSICRRRFTTPLFGTRGDRDELIQ